MDGDVEMGVEDLVSLAYTHDRITEQSTRQREKGNRNREKEKTTHELSAGVCCKPKAKGS